MSCFPEKTTVPSDRSRAEIEKLTEAGNREATLRARVAELEAERDDLRELLKEAAHFAPAGIAVHIRAALEGKE